jgi:hypothetical protein
VIKRDRTQAKLFTLKVTAPLLPYGSFRDEIDVFEREKISMGDVSVLSIDVLAWQDLQKVVVFVRKCSIL